VHSPPGHGWQVPAVHSELTQMRESSHASPTICSEMHFWSGSHWSPSAQSNWAHDSPNFAAAPHTWLQPSPAH